MIPVANLYGMMAFALYDQQAVSHETMGHASFDGPRELLARLYLDVLHKLVRRGIARSYVEHGEEGPRPRGRLDLAPTVSRALLLRGHVAFRYDELVADRTENRVLLAALRVLLADSSVESKTRGRLRTLLPSFEHVAMLSVGDALRAPVKAPRENRHYQAALPLAQLTLAAIVSERRGGRTLLPEWARDEAHMAGIFEGFVRGAASYYLGSAARVSARYLRFDVSAHDPAIAPLVPIMKTDVYIERAGAARILECKYYKSPLTQSHYSETARLRNDHLYQLLTYLRIAARDGLPVSGALVYARVDQDFGAALTLEGFDVEVHCLDLNQPWARLRETVLGVVRASDQVESQRMVGALAQ